jgi:hypothetical protein
MYLNSNQGGPGSSVSIGIGYGLDSPGIKLYPCIAIKTTSENEGGEGQGTE